jgi:hypothetical protein
VARASFQSEKRDWTSPSEIDGAASDFFDVAKKDRRADVSKWLTIKDEGPVVKWAEKARVALETTEALGEVDKIKR